MSLPPVSSSSSSSSFHETHLPSTPEKWYPIVPDENNPKNLNILLTPSGHDFFKNNVPSIYVLRKAPVDSSHPAMIEANMSPTERRSIGFTYRGPLKRIGEHLQKSKRVRAIDFSSASPTESTAPKRSSTLYEDLEKDRQLSLSIPEYQPRFQCGVMKAFPSGVPENVHLEDLEKIAISGSKHPLYNRQCGGGGITAEEHLRRKRMIPYCPTPLPFSNPPSTIDQTLYEPSQWFSCKVNKAGWVCLKLPSNIALFKSEYIYVWRTKTDDRRLYGFSGQKSVASRVNSYFQNHSHKDLVREIQKHPENLEFSLAETVPADKDPGEREQNYIQAYNTQDPKFGYNRNKGGGGARPMTVHQRFSAKSEKQTSSSSYIKIPVLFSKAIGEE